MIRNEWDCVTLYFTSFPYPLTDTVCTTMSARYMYLDFTTVCISILGVLPNPAIIY